MRTTTRNGRKDSICDRMANVASVKMTAQRKRGSGRVRSKVTAGREEILIAGNQRWDACCLLALALTGHLQRSRRWAGRAGTSDR